MTLRDRLQKEIPHKLFFGILAGVILGIAVFMIYWLVIANSGPAQCGLPPMDIRVMKLDANGNEQWKILIESGVYDRAITILQTPDGGYAISGLYDNKVEHPSSRIIRLNRSGGIEWEKQYTQCEGGFEGFSLNPDGGYFAGRWYPGKILILDVDGGIKKVIQYGDEGLPSFFTPRGNQGFIAMLEDSNDRNTTVLSLDPDGRVLWMHNNTPIVALSESSLLVTSDGGCIVGGYTPEVKELFFVRLDNEGNEIWNATLGRSWDNRPLLMAEPRPGIYEIIYESARNSNTPPAIIMETFSVTYDDHGEILRQRMLDVSPPVSKMTELDYLAVHLSEKDYASSYGFGMPHTIVRLTDQGTYAWKTPVSIDWNDVIRIVPTDDGGCVVLGSSIQKGKIPFCSTC